MRRLHFVGFVDEDSRHSRRLRVFGIDPLLRLHAPQRERDLPAIGGSERVAEEEPQAAGGVRLEVEDHSRDDDAVHVAEVADELIADELGLRLDVRSDEDFVGEVGEALEGDGAVVQRQAGVAEGKPVRAFRDVGDVRRPDHLNDGVRLSRGRDPALENAVRAARAADQEALDALTIEELDAGAGAALFVGGLGVVGRDDVARAGNLGGRAALGNSKGADDRRAVDVAAGASLQRGRRQSRGSIRGNVVVVEISRFGEPEFGKVVLEDHG